MKPANTVAPNRPALMGSPAVDSMLRRNEWEAVQRLFRGCTYHPSHFPRVSTKRSLAASFPVHFFDGCLMDQIISTLMQFAKAYSTPLGILMGLMAFDGLSRMMRR